MRLLSSPELTRLAAALDPRLRSSALLAAVLAAAPVFAQQPVRVRSTDQPVPVLDPQPGRASIRLRIIDGRTGAPIAGAEACSIEEGEQPLPGELPIAATATSDADGFVELPLNGAWVMARAAGYGPAMEMDRSERVIPLARPLSVPVRCLDWRGVPLAGYLAGFCGGCGHTGDLTTAVTDGDGIAMLQGIDPGNGIADLYLQGAPIRFAYDSVDWESGAPPVRHSFRRGHVLHGTVLDTDGTPAAGAILGNNEKHRGPWARADEQGRFVLGGLSEPGGFLVCFRGRKLEFTGPFRSPCTLQLPPPNGDVVEEGDPRPNGPNGTVRLAVQLPATAKQFAVQFTGPRPSHRVELADEDDAELALPAGHYEVLATAPGCAPRTAAIDVVAAAATELALALAPLPTATIRLRNAPAGVLVTLVDDRDDGDPDITEAVAAGTPIPIDAAAEYAVRIESDEQRRTFPASGMALLVAKTTTFSWYQPTRVLAALVDGDGAPIAADVALVADLPRRDCDGPLEEAFDPGTVQTTPVDDGRLALQTEKHGMRWLFVRPRDGGLRPRLLAVPLPERGDDVKVDLGQVRFVDTPQLRLLAADGSPLRRIVALLRPGTCDLREHVYRVFRLAADGGWQGCDLQPGDAILVPVSDEPEPDAQGVPTVALPLRAVVDGQGPTLLQVPRGRLRLLVTDANGAPLAATVLLRECMWPVLGDLRIAQVPAGSHRLFVAADGYRSAVVEAELTDGDERELRVALPAR